MGKTKETGRLTRQNAVNFKKEVNATLAAQQAQIDQLKAKSVEDASTISTLKRGHTQLQDLFDKLIAEFKAFREAEFETAPEAKPDGNLSDKYLGDQLAVTTGDNGGS